MKLKYSELTVLLTKIIPLEIDPMIYESERDQWEQKNLNSAIRKLESEATRLRHKENE